MKQEQVFGVYNEGSQMTDDKFKYANGGFIGEFKGFNVTLSDELVLTKEQAQKLLDVAEIIESQLVKETRTVNVTVNVTFNKEVDIQEVASQLTERIQRERGKML